MDSDFMSKLIFFFIIFIIFSFIYKIVSQHRRLSKLRRSELVQIGMDEEEMLSIMGGGYTISYLKNNRIKYEWRINAKSSGTSYKGISSRSYTGVKKATIYVKNGVVEEVLGYNLY